MFFTSLNFVKFIIFFGGLVLRIFVSETYELIDGTFVDRGTSSDYGAWTNWSGKEPKLVRNSEYCAMTVDTGKEDARMYKQLDTSSNNVVIEFDCKYITDTASNVFATHRNDAGNVLGNWDMSRFTSYGANINEWHHFKVTVTLTNVIINIDNNANSYTYNSTGTTRLYLQISSGELDYKNFVIYPI